MAEEFQKRPFARLLILWISGICIATYVPLPAWMGIGTAWFLFLLLQMTKQSGARLSFASRGNWGIVFATLFLCLSVGYVRYRLRLEGAEELPAWQTYFQEWQVRLLASLDVLDLKEQDKNVLATLTLGYRQHLDWTVRERFNFSGAAHILSVSGFHVGVVYAFLRTCLFFLPERMLFRYVKQALLLAGIWIFTLLAGMESPAVQTPRPAYGFLQYVGGVGLLHVGIQSVLPVRLGFRIELPRRPFHPLLLPTDTRMVLPAQSRVATALGLGGGQRGGTNRDASALLLLFRANIVGLDAGRPARYDLFHAPHSLCPMLDCALPIRMRLELGRYERGLAHCLVLPLHRPHGTHSASGRQPSLHADLAGPFLPHAHCL